MLFTLIAKFGRQSQIKKRCVTNQLFWECWAREWDRMSGVWKKNHRRKTERKCISRKFTFLAWFAFKTAINKSRRRSTHLEKNWHIFDFVRLTDDAIFGLFSFHVPFMESLCIHLLQTNTHKDANNIHMYGHTPLTTTLVANSSSI